MMVMVDEGREILLYLNNSYFHTFVLGINVAIKVRLFISYMMMCLFES